MSKHVLRWQYGLLSGETKTHYTHGHINTLREKAKVLAKNEKILYITIDEVKEVIKDTREEEYFKYMNHLGEDISCKHFNNCSDMECFMCDRYECNK